MAQFSFIDAGQKDFLRDEDGNVIIKYFDNYTEAEDWLLDHGEEYGWTNQGVRYWNWDEEMGTEGW